MDLIIYKKANLLINNIRKGEIVWKPGKRRKHLSKRKLMGHIPQTYSLDDYDALIQSIVTGDGNEVYLYYKVTFDQKYFAFGDRKRGWEVIVGENGVIDTAYEIVDMPYEHHFEKEGYYLLGTLKEVENYGRFDEENK